MNDGHTREGLQWHGQPHAAFAAPGATLSSSCGGYGSAGVCHPAEAGPGRNAACAPGGSGSHNSNSVDVFTRLSAAQMALNRLSPNNEPLTGESGFFEQHFFVGFWHDVPPVVPPPPGQQEAPRAPPVLQDLSRYKAPEACRYGQACRFKLSCSRFHGEQSVHGRNCTCEEEDCLKGHPLRAGRDRQRPQASLPGASLTPLTGGGTATAGGLSTTAPWPAQQHRSPFRRQPPPGYTCAPTRTPCSWAASTKRLSVALAVVRPRSPLRRACLAVQSPTHAPTHAPRDCVLCADAPSAARRTTTSTSALRIPASSAA